MAAVVETTTAASRGASAGRSKALQPLPQRKQLCNDCGCDYNVKDDGEAAALVAQGRSLQQVAIAAVAQQLGAFVQP